MWLGYGSYGPQPYTDCPSFVRNPDMVQTLMELLGFWKESPRPTAPDTPKK